MNFGPHYDFIIAGGGLAGLSLALNLIDSPLRDRSILIVDHDAAACRKRTWSYWSDRPTRFDGLACRTWDQLQLAGLAGERRTKLRRYRYHTIRGVDFYQHARQVLSAYPNVRWQHGQVEKIEEGVNHGQVTIDQQVVTGDWIFDSTGQHPLAPAPDRRYHWLKMHFKGWEIETSRSVFDPSAATFLDFRTPQQGAVRFCYGLPFDERHALVEYTVFSRATLPAQEYAAALQTYLQTILQIEDYRVLRQESGVISLTDRPAVRQTNGRVMTIGLRGGRLKPTTGFAFTRIQADSAAIVQSLLQHDRPFDIPPDSARYRLYDALLLDIMEREPERIQAIFAALFKRNSLEQVLRFLDEAAPWWDNVRMFATLPAVPFLQALSHVGRSSLHTVTSL